VVGSAEPGSTVSLYTDPACSSAVAGSGPASSFSGAGIPVGVPDNSTTSFHATATDDAGNVSACSTGSVTYVEDSTGSSPPPPPVPNTVLGKAPKKRIKVLKTARVRFSFSSATPGATFQCRIDKKAYAPCTSPKAYTLRIGSHKFSVRAVVAGVPDPTPATYAIRVLKKH
jgi:hypothetical protein